MQSSESRTFAQFGGFLLLVSLALPYFALSFAGLGSHGFRLWSMDKGAFVLVAAYGLLALAQVKFSSRETAALIYLIVGALFTAALIYKFWISPPGSAPIGDLGGAAGSATVNGKSIARVSAGELLKAMGIELKPSYGAYVAMLGSAFFTAGAFIEFRRPGAAAAPVGAPQGAVAGAPTAAATQQPVSPAQRYQAPIAGQAANAATVAAVPPDPFAAPQQRPQPPVIPPDPFAAPQLRQQQPAQQQPAQQPVQQQPAQQYVPPAPPVPPPAT